MKEREANRVFLAAKKRSHSSLFRPRVHARIRPSHTTHRTSDTARIRPGLTQAIVPTQEESVTTGRIPPSSTMSQPPLPIIDVSPFLSLATSSTPAAAAAAAGIKAAFTPPAGAGFFYATGHGIPEADTEAVFSALSTFFSAPQPVKDALAAANNPLYRGYVGSGSLAHSCAPGESGKGGEVKESMTVGMEEKDAKTSTPSPMHGPNQWPPEADVPGFQPAVRTYLAAGLRAASAVARGTAAALGLPSDWFEAALTDPVAQLVLLRYPGVENGGVREGGPEAALPTGCGAHTDCGLITLVAQRGPPGLQVAKANPSSTTPHWATAPPIPGTLVVNFGDLASFWSGGAIPSTLHRVVSPPLGGPPRESVILFANARFGAEVVAGGAAAVVGAVGDAKRTTAGLYILEKLGLMWLAEKEGGKEAGGGD